MTKKFSVVILEKVSAIGMQGSSSRAYESELEKEAMYLDCDLAGFKATRKRNQRQNIYSDRYREFNREHNGD